MGRTCVPRRGPHPQNVAHYGTLELLSVTAFTGTPNVTVHLGITAS